MRDRQREAERERGKEKERQREKKRKVRDRILYNGRTQLIMENSSEGGGRAMDRDRD